LEEGAHSTGIELLAMELPGDNDQQHSLQEITDDEGLTALASRCPDGTLILIIDGKSGISYETINRKPDEGLYLELKQRRETARFGIESDERAGTSFDDYEELFPSLEVDDEVEPQTLLDLLDSSSPGVKIIWKHEAYVVVPSSTNLVLTVTANMPSKLVRTGTHQLKPIEREDDASLVDLAVRCPLDVMILVTDGQSGTHFKADDIDDKPAAGVFAELQQNDEVPNLFLVRPDSASSPSETTGISFDDYEDLFPDRRGAPVSLSHTDPLLSSAPLKERSAPLSERSAPITEDLPTTDPLPEHSTPLSDPESDDTDVEAEDLVVGVHPSSKGPAGDEVLFEKLKAGSSLITDNGVYAIKPYAHGTSIWIEVTANDRGSKKTGLELVSQPSAPLKKIKTRCPKGTMVLYNDAEDAGVHFKQTKEPTGIAAAMKERGVRENFEIAGIVPFEGHDDLFTPPKPRLRSRLKSTVGEPSRKLKPSAWTTWKEQQQVHAPTPKQRELVDVDVDETEIVNKFAAVLRRLNPKESVEKDRDTWYRRLIKRINNYPAPKVRSVINSLHAGKHITSPAQLDRTLFDMFRGTSQLSASRLDAATQAIRHRTEVALHIGNYRYKMTALVDDM